MKIKHALALCSLVLATTHIANAEDNLRCGNSLINVGDDQQTVLEKCGEPSSNDGWTWIYDRGSDQYTAYIHFDSDYTVSRIEEKDDM